MDALPGLEAPWDTAGLRHMYVYICIVLIHCAVGLSNGLGSPGQLPGLASPPPAPPGAHAGRVSGVSCVSIHINM